MIKLIFNWSLVTLGLGENSLVGTNVLFNFISSQKNYEIISEPRARTWRRS
jgi:hypothetical protein